MVKIAFKNTVIISTVFCLIHSFLNIALLDTGGIPEVLGAAIFSSIPAIIYILVKRKSKDKSGITFFILQNILGLLSLIGNALPY